MTVFRRKDRGNAWNYEFVLGGKRYRGQCLDDAGKPVKTRTEAVQREIAAKAAAQQRQALDRSGVRAGAFTITQASLVLLKRARDRHADDGANLRIYLAELLAFFGPGTPMNRIGDGDVDRYRDFSDAQILKTWAGGPGVRKADVADPADPKHWRTTKRRRSKTTTNKYLKTLRQLFGVAEKVRDPATGKPAIDRPPTITPHRLPRRLPRPIPDRELHARLAVAPPWTADAGELARLFGLRLTEALTVGRRHVDREIRGLRFSAGETKSGNDEVAFGGAAGWQLLLRLEKQAIARGVDHLIAWPGPKHQHAGMIGAKVPRDAWRPLKSVRRSWKHSAKVAQVDDPHRFHDVRARYITEVAKVQQSAAKGAARHQDPATTDLYIQLAATEIADAVRKAAARRPKAKDRTERRSPVGTPVGTLPRKRA